MESSVIFSALTQLYDEGRLTGDNLRFDGELLTTAVEGPSSLYRPDGWAKETTEYGARSHKALDAVFEEFRNGNWAQQQVANSGNFPEFLMCYSPTTKYQEGSDPHNLVSDDPEAAAKAQEAYSNIMIMASWLYQPTDIPVAKDFKLRLPESKAEPAKNVYYKFPEGHAVIFDPDGDYEDVPEFYIQDQIRRMRKQAKRLYGGNLPTPPGDD